MSKNNDLYYEIDKNIFYKNNDILKGDNPIFKCFYFDKQLFSSGIDKELVDIMEDIMKILNENKKEFLLDQADKIYFYKNVFALVCIVNPKYPNTGYSIKIDLNDIKYKKPEKNCLIS